MLSYVKVRFKKTDTSTYTYLVDGAPDELSRFTHAVVDSPYGGLTVVDIISFGAVDESTYDGKYKHVITVFDLESYNTQLNKNERKAAIEKELRRRVAKKKLEDNFSALLAGDEESEKLIAEYKTL